MVGQNMAPQLYRLPLLALLRVPLRFCLLLVAALLCFLSSLVCLPLLELHRKNQYIKTWIGVILWCAGVRWHLRDQRDNKAEIPVLLASNHLSWCDIVVILRYRWVRFVAKAAIAHWPIVGYLARLSGTFFIDRTKQADAKRLRDLVVQKVQELPVPVAFFPEGTVGLPGDLLPLHPSLFDIAINTDMPVLPVVVHYRPRDPSSRWQVDEVSRSFMGGLIHFLKEPIDAEIVLLPNLPTQGKARRQVATEVATVMQKEIQRFYSSLA